MTTQTVYGLHYIAANGDRQLCECYWNPRDRVFDVYEAFETKAVERRFVKI